MRIHGLFCALGVLTLSVLAVPASAAPLITAIKENGTALNANTAIATSASSPSPSGTSAALVDEAFAYTTRTHEWTAARVDPATGLLNTAATGTLMPFPSYLNGLEYVQIANENRSVADYSIDLTFAQPVKAYLWMDNRNNGTGAGLTSPITTDPDLGGPLAWVVNDGWTRVNTHFMPNDPTGAPQADYLGVDEGAAVANETLRVHTGSNTVAGSGNGLDRFMAIYTKNFPAGLNVGVGKANVFAGDMYGIAVSTVPEPNAIILAAIGGCGALAVARRRKA